MSVHRCSGEGENAAEVIKHLSFTPWYLRVLMGHAALNRITHIHPRTDVVTWSCSSGQTLQQQEPGLFPKQAPLHGQVHQYGPTYGAIVMQILGVLPPLHLHLFPFLHSCKRNGEQLQVTLDLPFAVTLFVRRSRSGSGKKLPNKITSNLHVYYGWAQLIIVRLSSRRELCAR